MWAGRIRGTHVLPPPLFSDQSQACDFIASHASHMIIFMKRFLTREKFLLVQLIQEVSADSPNFLRGVNLSKELGTKFTTVDIQPK